MKRHFYIGDDLSDLKLISSELEGNGFSKPQIHLISKNHGSSYLDSLMPMKNDFLRSLFKNEITIILTLMSSSLIGVFSYGLDFPLAIIILLSCLSVPILFFVFQRFANVYFNDPAHAFDQSQIKLQLEQGRHVLLVELSDYQQRALDQVITNHPEIEYAGIHDYS